MKFRMDSPFVTVGIKIANLLILNFYWIVGCLPVITIGTSTIAAFTVTLKMTEDAEDMSMTRQFWSAYLKNLKHGIPLTLLAGAVIYGVWLDWQMFEKLEGNPTGFLILAIAAVFLLVIHYLYIFPLEARYENKLSVALVNSRRICVRFFLRTLSLIGILLVQGFLFSLNALMMYIGIFCAPILAIYTISQITMPIFHKLDGDSTAHDGFRITDRDWGGE
ncbi:MAG: YesL family protein [Candidatus Limivicinus sp.]